MDLKFLKHQALLFTCYFLLFTFFSACPTKKASEVAAPVPLEPAPVAADTVQPPPPPLPEPPPESERPTVGLSPLRQGVASVRPGEPALVTVAGNLEQLAVAQAFMGDTVSPILPGPESEGPWLGMVAVNRDREAGEATVRVLLTFLNGSTVGSELPLAVRPRTYPSARLTVAPEMARTPPERLKQVEQDRAAFGAVWAAPASERMWSGRFVMPTKGRISSTFGERRVFNGDVKSRHSGLDIAAPAGAPVRASNAGRVALVRKAYVEGLTVVVDHGGGVFTFYCHLSKARVVEGDVVTAGQRIGDVGMSGRATGPHLHWGVRVAGERVDGLALLALRPGEEVKSPARPSGRNPKGGVVSVRAKS